MTLVQASAQLSRVVAQDVVWERLCAVNGDTEFVDSSFTGHAGRSVMQDALQAARLAQDAFRDVVPPSGALSAASCRTDTRLWARSEVA